MLSWSFASSNSWMRPLRLNLFDSFMGVKFSFANIFVFYIKLCLGQSILPSFLLFNRTFLHFFLFTKHTIIFWDFCLSDLPNIWHASISWRSKNTPISATNDPTNTTKTSSDCGIPLNSTLLRRPYCAKALWSNSYIEHHFSKRSHLRLNFSCLSCRFLMKISLWLLFFEEVNMINNIVCHSLHLVFLVIYDWLTLFSCIINMDNVLID